MDLNETRREILNRVASGELSIEQANRLLEAIESDDFLPEPQEAPVPTGPVEPVSQPAEPLPPALGSAASTGAVDPAFDRAAAGEAFNGQVSILPDPAGEDEVMKDRIARWQRYWVLPFILGLVITAFGAYWMYLGWMAAGPGWGFWLSWIPFFIGIGLAVLAFYSTKMPWLHLSVQENTPGHETNVNLTFPLPLGVAAWGLTRFDHYLPDDVRGKNAGDLVAEFEKSIGRDEPMHIVVDEENQHVDIALFRL